MARTSLTRGRRRPRWVLPTGALAVVLVVAIIVAIVATGGSGGSSSKNTGAAAGNEVNLLAPPGAPQSKPAGAPSLAGDDATGVTPTSITVGIQSPDEQTLTKVGAAVAPIDVQAVWKVFLDDLNAKGGINGRTVVPVYTTTDPVDTNKMREACLNWTQDRKVFAVLGFVGYYGPPVQCVTAEHGTPFIDVDGQPAAWQDGTSRGLLYTLPTGKDRVLRNWADWLDRSHLLKGHTLGLVESGGFDAQTVDRALVSELTRRGYKITTKFTFSTDFVEAGRQFQLAASQLQRSGVDMVLSAAGFYEVSGLVNSTTGLGYHPQWVFSDFAGGSGDLVASKLPKGTKAVGTVGNRTGENRVGIPEAPVDKACRETYEKATGKTLDRTSSEAGAVTSICGVVQVFAKGITNAGPNLTRRTFSDGIAAIGPIDLPAYGAASFRPGKYDGADTARVVQFDSNCTCWLPLPGSMLQPLPLP